MRGGGIAGRAYISVLTVLPVDACAYRRLAGPVYLGYAPVLTWPPPVPQGETIANAANPGL